MLHCGVIAFTTLRTSEFANYLCYVIVRLVILILLALYVYNRNSHFTIQKDKSQKEFGKERKVCIDDYN